MPRNVYPVKPGQRPVYNAVRTNQARRGRPHG